LQTKGDDTSKHANLFYRGARMSDNLTDMFKKFQTTKSVFIANLEDGGAWIRLQPVKRYDPNTVELDATDPIVKMMIEEYSEIYDKHNRKYVVDETMLFEVLNAMSRRIKKSFLMASPLKKPQNSATFKWLEGFSLKDEGMRDNLMALYRYVFKHTDDRYDFDGSSESPHAKNLVAIIEKMRSKYER
jgi:hypothetical protein